MPTYIRYATPTDLITAISGASLQNLANNSFVSGPEINNTPSGGAGDLEADFLLAVSYQSGPPDAGTRVADIFVLYAVDGTNYPSDAHTQDEQYVGSFVARAPSTIDLEYIPLRGIPIRPLKFKVMLKNVSGVNFKNNADNKLSVQLSQLQVINV